MFVQRKYERDNATQAYLQRKNERDNMVTLRSMVTDAGHGIDNVLLSVELGTKVNSMASRVKGLVVC